MLHDDVWVDFAQEKMVGFHLFENGNVLDQLSLNQSQFIQGFRCLNKIWERIEFFYLVHCLKQSIFF